MAEGFHLLPLFCFPGVWIKVALSVFFRVPSEFPNAQGSGPSGYFRTSFMLRFLLLAFRSMRPKSLLSALRMVSRFAFLDVFCFFKLLTFSDSGLAACHEI